MKAGPWIEERTGALTAMRSLGDGLRRPIGTSRSTAALVSVLVLLAINQAATGSLLGAYYQPAWDQAHASVERIVTLVPAGWLIRSLHLWGAHLMLLTLPLLLLRAFFRRSYRTPREALWFVAVALLGIVSASAITGQMLPMDEEAYNGALVAADLADTLPGMGRLVRGGNQVGEYMLGRFFAAHVFWLPTVAVLLALAAAAIARRVARPATDGPTRLECVGGAAAFGALVLGCLAVLFPAGVGPPADPLETSEGVKPLWFFLPLYQAAKYLPSSILVFLQIAGFALFLLVPVLDRGPRSRRILTIAGSIALAAVLLAGAAGALSHRTIGSYRIDLHGVPHRVQPGP